MKKEHVDTDANIPVEDKNISNENIQQLRNFIITQLATACPASLPFTIIAQGISCIDSTCGENIILQILQNLASEGSIIKISECGFCDRYQLVNSSIPHTPWEDENA